ncbi:MAG TPA: hypothetical protein VHC39_03030 [Rhizomicrobium sp.]|nr:hypothetical protein [Rhizomicrobium sp.]
MKFVFMKLMPPRADFMQSMTPEELGLMRAHQAYWAGFAQKGWAVAYGPVADPSGGYGAGFWALPDDQDPQALADGDPVIQARQGFRYDIFPMPALVIGKAAQGGQ